MRRGIRKTIVFGIVLVLVFIVFAGMPMNVSAEGEYSSYFAGGTGTENDPYQISTVEQLQNVKYNPYAHYIMMNDIDASDTINWNNGAGFLPLGLYGGSFNGKGYKITDLFIKRGGLIGLFGEIYNHGTVANVGLEDVNITGGHTAGGLAAWNCWWSSIIDSYATGNVSGYYHTGGLVGYNYGKGAIIKDSYAICNVSGIEEVGGLIGDNSASISNSYYNIDATIINGRKMVTPYGIYENQFDDWLINNKVLDINDHLMFNSNTGYYELNNINDLKAFVAFSKTNYKFKLTGNIDLINEPEFHIPFLSVDEFDGGNNVIKNLYLNRPQLYYLGLFGYNSYSKIKNIRLENCNVYGITHIGGLIGNNYGGSISNSYTTGTVNGLFRIGGLVGWNYGSIMNSFSTACVTGNIRIGGLVGYNGNSILNSYATGSVTGFTWGNVPGQNIGGLAGINYQGSVINSYATGRVIGYIRTGGLLGSSYQGTISNSFWDTETSGIGGGKTTAEMKTISTFTDAGWDFTNIWKIIEGKSYPYLWYEYLPAANAGSDQTVLVDEIFILDGSNSYDTDGSIVSYYWDFGDTNSGFGINPSHSYDTVGTYIVTLTVTDDDGETDSDTIIIRAIDEPPIADIGGPYQDNEGNTILFDASNSYDPVGFPIQYRWDFNNDGTWDTTWSDSPYMEFVYGDDYYGEIKLEVTNGEFIDTDSATMTVNNVAPTVNAGSDQTVNEGDIVYFTGAFSDPGYQDSHTIEWDFGDGDSVSGTLTPNHIFKDNGIYTVTLTVTDDDGGVGFDTLIITVDNVAPTVEIAKIGSEGVIVSFSGTFTDPGIEDTHTFEWDFGDGNTNTDSLTPTHVYDDCGVYTVSLTVVDNNGGVGSDSLIVATFSGGSGTVENPYQISDCYQLQNMKYYLDAHYILANDIDASVTSTWNGGTGFEPIGTSAHRFIGTLDGNNYKISGLYINRPYTYYIGLFGFAHNCILENIGLKNIDINGYAYVGGLIGWSYSSSISNSYTSGYVSGTNDYVGGLIGYCDGNSKISNCYAMCSVSGKSLLGGLAGYNYQSLISTSYATGSVSGTEYLVGGLIGVNTGQITNSYSTGDVIGNRYIGGLVGANTNLIKNSYSTGKVTGNQYIGGFLGYNSGSTINSYWDIETSGTTIGVGYGVADGVLGKTTQDLKKQATFVEWDFENIWIINEHQTYPILGWQLNVVIKATHDLITEIEALNLPGGTENNLVSKLNDAIKLFEKENLNGAIHKLGDFIDYANAQRGKKLTDGQADMLIDYAQWIIDNI